uniref:Uncharacterized protein n=2 Tax=Vibrio alginolyticus TaxID=663 RepID=A0A1P8DPN0_VIBAL|nr:hypothetical protein [Vibrio alginolyticus]
MTDITTDTFLSNLKKAAKSIKNTQNVSHSEALDLAAISYGFDSYHALTARRKRINNEANTPNANLGTNGVNRQYAQAQGNRGKQLNPNQKSSLIIAFNDDLIIRRFDMVDGVVKSTAENFKTEYLDKGFAEEIGGKFVLRKGDKSFLKHHYHYIEILKDKTQPWTVEEANKLLEEQVSDRIGKNYREFMYIDGKLVRNHISDEREAEYNRYDDIQYHPAIDGYYDSY